MAKKKAKKRGGAKKAAGKKRQKRTEKETHVDAKMNKLLDDAVVSGGFMAFEVHGDAIGGEILAIETVKGRWGPQQKITVKTTDGSKTFFCSTMLGNFVEENAVTVGDMLAVRYVDDAPSGKGAPAKLFKIVHVPGKGKRKS